MVQPDAYQSAPTEGETTQTLCSTPYSKNNPKYIQLQRVESQLNQYVIIKTWLGICFLYALFKLISDFRNEASTPEKAFHNNIDKVVRLFQMVGYGYGLGSFNKSVFHWKIFFAYFWLSYVIIAYFVWLKAWNGELWGVALNVANAIWNVPLMIWSYKILTLLKKRDELKTGLKEEQLAHDKQQNMLP